MAYTKCLLQILVTARILMVKASVEPEPGLSLGYAPSPGMDITTTLVQTVDEYGCYAGQYNCTDPEGWVYCNDFPCPTVCTYPQQDCYTDQYSTSGWWIGTAHTCVANQNACPCGTGQNRCTDDWGHSYCNYGPCPCVAPNKTCYNYAYDSMGYIIDYNAFTCATGVCSSCTGSRALSTPCLDPGGDSYTCEPSAYYTSCPVTCDWSQGQIYCDTYAYDNNGNINWNIPPNTTCGNSSSGCPCNPIWEVECNSYGYKYCQSNAYSCPLDCGTALTCWYYTYNSTDGSFLLDRWGYPKFNETCAPAGATRCPCDPTHEHTCNVTYGGFTDTECFSKTWYPTCPVDCGSQVTCWVDSYDTNGLWTGSAPVCAASYADCQTNATCSQGTNAHLCDGDYFCSWNGETCPTPCAGEKCWVDYFDSNGYWLNTNTTCVNAGEQCPCGGTAVRCTDHWGSYCAPSCPLSCDYSTQKLCTSISYYANGTMDFNSITDSCQAKSATCPCGSNANTCSWYVSWTNTTEHWCQANTWDCPVQCRSSALPDLCSVINYDQRGNMIEYKETCSGSGVRCQCGGNSTRCTHSGQSWCEPAWDQYANPPGATECPLDCASNASQYYCSVPNFDGSGNDIGTVEFCETKGRACDCTKGSNSKSCTTAGITECTPRVGANSYCAATCPADKITCPKKENYNPNTGVYVDWSAPSDANKCKSTYADCPCGTGARKCPNGKCVPTVFSCPVVCTGTQTPCVVVNYDVNGTITKETSSCLVGNATCACGTNSKKCSKSSGGQVMSFCVPTATASETCPCKASEQICQVEDFDTKGKFVSRSARCVTLGSKCPCGANTKSCANPADASETTCEPKFNSESSACPAPCTHAQEVAGNQTCVKTNLNKTGFPVSKSTTCELECTPGRGQKKCATKAIIRTGTACEDIYAVLTTNATSSRRLAAMTIGHKQTSSLSFTLNNLVSTSTDSSGIKTNLDSILQLQSSLTSTLTIQITGSGQSAEASLQYEVTNQGASAVEPQEVTESLRTKLNAQNVQTKSALAPLGTVKQGTRGCCSVSTQSKHTAVDGVTTSTAGPSATTQAGAQEPEPAAAGPAPAPAPALGPAGYAQVITGSFTLNVSNVDTFVNDLNAKAALRTGLSTAASINVSYIAIDLTKLRRLHSTEQEEEEDDDEEEDEAHLRRLSDFGSVKADYTITLPDSMSAAEHSAVFGRLGAMNATSLTTHMKDAMTNAGLNYTVTVTGVTAPSYATTTTSVNQGSSGSVKLCFDWSTFTLLILLGTSFLARKEVRERQR